MRAMMGDRSGGADLVDPNDAKKKLNTAWSKTLDEVPGDFFRRRAATRGVIRRLNRTLFVQGGHHRCPPLGRLDRVALIGSIDLLPWRLGNSLQKTHFVKSVLYWVQ